MNAVRRSFLGILLMAIVAGTFLSAWLVLDTSEVEAAKQLLMEALNW